MCAALAAILVISFTGPAVDISAATSQELKKQRDKTQSQLNSANSKASSLESEQESVSEELDQKTEEIAQNMTSISLMEDDIADLQDQINAKTLEYNDALERQQKHRLSLTAKQQAPKPRLPRRLRLTQHQKREAASPRPRKRRWPKSIKQKNCRTSYLSPMRMKKVTWQRQKPPL